jgi:hypothetical protein
VSFSTLSLCRVHSLLHFRFSKVYWVDGTSPQTMEASIAAIASADEDAQAAGIEARSASVLPWLASHK